MSFPNLECENHCQWFSLSCTSICITNRACQKIITHRPALMHTVLNVLLRDRSKRLCEEVFWADIRVGYENSAFECIILSCCTDLSAGFSLSFSCTRTKTHTYTQAHTYCHTDTLNTFIIYTPNIACPITPPTPPAPLIH